MCFSSTLLSHRTELLMCLYCQSVNGFINQVNSINDWHEWALIQYYC